MADTIEQRVTDVESMLAHIPEDLDARFAGVDVKPAELRELILLQNSRFTKIEARLNAHAAAVDAKFAAVDAKLAAMDGKFAVMDAKLDEILKRLPPAS
jgi:predicted  nucleic acid-binding Zn-ribbon protein